LLALIALVAAFALPNAFGETATGRASHSWAPEKKLDLTPKIRYSNEIGRDKSLRTIARQYIARHPNRTEYVPATTHSRRPSAPAALSSASVFDGISNDTIVAPPDPTGDISTTQYVESVNSDNGALVAVFDRSGRVLEGPFRMERLWNKGDQCRENGQGDPIVQYDQLADRWILTQFAFTYGDQLHGPYYECVAVSETNDATGQYYGYSFKISKDKLPDYPKFGVWPDGYYMSIHLFGNQGNNFSAQGVIAFDRERMLLGQPARGMIFFVNEKLFGLLPADAQGPVPPPAGAPNYMAVLRDDNAGDKKDRILIYGFEANWDDPKSSDINGPTDLGRSASGPKPDPFNSNLCSGYFYCIPQKGSKYVKLDAIGANYGVGPYQMYPLAYRNFGDHESLVLNHTVRTDKRNHAGINWFEVRAPGEFAFINQQGTYVPDNKSRWIASLGMDKQNNIAMGYALSSKDIFPSIAYTGRLAGDPLGTMPQGEQLMVKGRGAQKGTARWGDYTAIAIDPVDDCTFWYINEYYPKTSAAHWNTAIGHFSFPSCISGESPSPSPSAASSPSATATP
jgi:hypothetical protein